MPRWKICGTGFLLRRSHRRSMLPLESLTQKIAPDILGRPGTLIVPENSECTLPPQIANKTVENPGLLSSISLNKS